MRKSHSSHPYNRSKRQNRMTDADYERDRIRRQEKQRAKEAEVERELRKQLSELED